jgi:hypothetical protein
MGVTIQCLQEFWLKEMWNDFMPVRGGTKKYFISLNDCIFLTQIISFCWAWGA